MISDGFNPVFVTKVEVATLSIFTWTRGVPTDGLDKIFIFVIKSTGIGYEFDVAFKQRHGIEHLHFLSLLPLDVLFGVGKPRTHGSRCGNGETNTSFEVAPITSRGAIEGIVWDSHGSVIDGDLRVSVVVGNACFFTEF